MLPTDYSDDIQTDFTIEPYPTRTYRLNFDGKPSIGMLDGLEAMKQTIYMILNSERYVYEIFSWNYGTELWPCFQTQDSLLFLAKLETAIREALLQDDRIISVDSFAYERKGNQLHLSFQVVTTEGDVESEAVFGETGMEVLF